MRKIWYMCLESYQSRYTCQLIDWNTAVFKRRGVDYEIVYGDDLTGDQIVTGSVLDAHGRSYYSLTQISKLVKLMKEGKVTSDDVIFFEDGFTPGMESLFYIIDQVPAEYRPRIFVRFLAQSMDPDDFVNREGMFDWMRPYEQMLDSRVDGILLANEEFVAHLRIAGFKAPIYVTGLPYNKDEVLSRIPVTKPITERTRRVCFGSRWDSEKQPDFYMDLAEKYFKIDPTVEFAVFSGHPTLKSNNRKFVDRATMLQNSSSANFKVYTGLKKNEYYALAADSWVNFNSALQDWQSNQPGELGTLGTLMLYPAYRSFPETFANNDNFLYVPWSHNSAISKLKKLFDNPDAYSMKPLVEWVNGAIDRTVDIFEGNGEQWSRNTLDYRKHVAVPKYTWD